MDVTMLLCDAAAESGGKLYVLGGGWSVVHAPEHPIPIPMALAVKISVPWDQSNTKHTLKLSLIDDDHQAIEVEGSEGPIEVGGEFEVGRPPGMKPGTPLDTPFAFSFPPIPLAPGGYVWELEIDGMVVSKAQFRVLGG